MGKENLHNRGVSAVAIADTFGKRSADRLTAAVGSWSFIFLILIYIAIWILLNTLLIMERGWDPYPFILLNFTLSCLAALQAPIILMSQKRQTERDRKRFEYDYAVNRKAEKEIEDIQKDLEEIKRKISGR